ncbi:hypothetical protein M9H77_02367 [Catharanthus roseus]|uniref:Uncharacterized protein n=1 Tax=Catharanthus roseus TaxID=4058 RepID=A0ACC0C862_CATRO|nr:hypothetical protein M9H77_02367 [Catharanthus roseus]
MRRLAKGVLNPVLLEDLGVILTSPPEVAVSKGRKKDKRDKRDKSYWEHVLIIHRKIQKLSGCGSSSSSGTGSGSWSKVRVNELVHRIHWPVDGPAPYEHWFETPDLFYVIVNAFNLCVILIAQLGSMTVLPLYAYQDHAGGTLVIVLLTEQQHFIQLQLNDGCLIPPLHVQCIHHRT